MCDRYLFVFLPRNAGPGDLRPCRGDSPLLNRVVKMNLSVPFPVLIWEVHFQYTVKGETINWMLNSANDTFRSSSHTFIALLVLPKSESGANLLITTLPLRLSGRLLIV